MPSPFEFFQEVRDMNENLSDKLDEVLDQLILLIDTIREKAQADLYGDGR